MRTITKKIAIAFKAGQGKAIGNTSTDGSAVFLHGNKIMERREGKILCSLSGWNTATTRERLNGILSTLDIKGRFAQKNFQPNFDGVKIDSHAWIVVS